MRVWVSKKDIENGCRGDPWSCPVALALKRKFGKRKEICVGATVTDIGKIRYYNSLSAEEFVRSFDNYNTVSPRYVYLTKKEKESWV